MNSISFELPHITLAGLTNGNTDKPLLLALHGWLDNAGSFEPMFPFLSDFNVIALDFPGHGFSSDRSPDAHYYFVDWVYDLCLLIRQQNWQNVIIVGHSMGGMVGQLVAAVLPDTVARLILIDAVGLITAPAEQACDQLKQAIESRFRMAKREKGVHSTEALALQARVLAGDIKDAQAQILAKRGLLKLDNGYQWRSDPRLRTHSAQRFDFEQAASFITVIQCPVLLIVGRAGAKMVKVQLQRYQQYFVELTTLEIDGGHHCHMEYPQQAAKLVTDFVHFK